MARLVLRALATLVGTILLASSGIFLLIHLSGDPTYGFLPPETSPEVREAVRQRLGLNDPIWKQYLLFVQDAFTLDFGYSWNLKRPAGDAVLNAFPSTMLLAVLGPISAVVTLFPVAISLPFLFIRAFRSGPLRGDTSPLPLGEAARRAGEGQQAAAGPHPSPFPGGEGVPPSPRTS